MVAISVLFLPPVAHFILVLSTWTGLLIFFTVLHYVKERSLADVERAESTADE